MTPIQKRMRLLPLLGLIAACSEPGGPHANTLAPSSEVTAAVADRPYAWSLSCQSSSYTNGGGISANWSWTEYGVPIVGTAQNAFCSPGFTPNNKVSGSGVRPANANGFLVCVGNSNCANWTSWTFDPSGSFKAQQKGSFSWYCDPFSGCTKAVVTVIGTFRVDS